jgi:hypothetical protein
LPGGLDGTLKFFDFHGMSEAKAEQPSAEVHSQSAAMPNFAVCMTKFEDQKWVFRSCCKEQSTGIPKVKST